MGGDGDRHQRPLDQFFKSAGGAYIDFHVCDPTSRVATSPAQVSRQPDPSPDGHSLPDTARGRIHEKLCMRPNRLPCDLPCPMFTTTNPPADRCNVGDMVKDVYITINVCATQPWGISH